MLARLIAADEAVFWAVNRGLENPFFDWLMPWLSSEEAYILPLAALVGWLIWQERRSVIWLLAGMALLLLFTDAATAHLWRPLLARPRPYTILENIHLFQGGVWLITSRLDLAAAATNSYGLPSAHAANSLGLGFYLLRFHRRLGLALIGLALAIGFSRVYLGCHFPADVAAGYLWGAASGLVMAWLISRLKTRFTREFFKRNKITSKSGSAGCPRL